VALSETELVANAGQVAGQFLEKGKKKASMLFTTRDRYEIFLVG
jgi:hypothetical protein